MFVHSVHSFGLCFVLVIRICFVFVICALCIPFVFVPALYLYFVYVFCVFA